MIDAKDLAVTTETHGYTDQKAALATINSNAYTDTSLLGYVTTGQGNELELRSKFYTD